MSKKLEWLEAMRAIAARWVLAHRVRICAEVFSPPTGSTVSSRSALAVESNGQWTLGLELHFTFPHALDASAVSTKRY